MKLTKMEEDLRIHQKLDDEPNDVGGLTAQELKAKFDQAGLAIQSYLNETHLPETEAAVEEAVEEAKSYTDKKVAGLGTGDMSAAVYDTQKRRADVFEYAEAKAREAKEDTSKLGYVCGGTDWQVAHNATVNAVKPEGAVDPKGIWPVANGALVAPAGAKAVVVHLRGSWARQILGKCFIRLKVNGEGRDIREGPDTNNGVHVIETMILIAEVEEGDEVTLELEARKGASSSNSNAEIILKDIFVEFVL